MIFFCKRFFFMVPVLFLIVGCTSITQDEAEAKALQFINENVKFFAREENSTLNLPGYRVESMTSYKEDNNWVVAVHVSAELDGEIKKNDLLVKLNRKGEVIELNGKGISKGPQ